MFELINRIARILQDSGIANYRQESRWIAEESPDAAAALENARRRGSGEPLQYILGTAPFRNLMLKVDPRVLIPRPETETLVQWIIDRAPTGASVLDLGCGSGAISISLADERRDLQVTAADISIGALELAQENARECGVEIEFLHSDLFSALSGRKFDFIAANLPYVTESEYAELDPEVREYEPVLALTAPDDGLELILKTIARLPEHLLPGGRAIFELSPPQTGRTIRALNAVGLHGEIVKDLCGRDRFVTGSSL